MSTPKLTIKHIIHKYGYEDWHEVEFYLDDKLIGGGNYGGEPEDNSYYRTYRWVEPAYADLAKALDIQVELKNETIVEKE